MKCRYALFKALPLLLAMLPAAGHSETYPLKPVRMIVPFPPGGGADVTSRIFAPKLTEALGQQFFIDNRAGAAGTIGTGIVARAAPDGYTLLVALSSVASSVSLYKNLSFDLSRDFSPIAVLATAPFVLAVHPSLPTKRVKELIALAKARPGQLNYASTGKGGAPHLTMEMFRIQAGIDIVHVPYKGAPAAIPDLIGGQVSMMFASTLALLPQVKAGRLRALGITSAKRSSLAPELPTIAESGLPGFESTSWFALLAPAGTPREVVTGLNATIAKIALTPEIIDRLAAQGGEPLVVAPKDVAAFVQSEIAKWGKVVAAAGIRTE
ncbi:MAG: hypothetical protein A3G24_05005 [Betaproteobacteria bacterium RIFCSPLOWO2_12_FULL_62_13]|nr:MAG: hypothetical protein A3G24_05005 [Betaproteobacteria bacterium RIFCSPLOWO2_12_FULL_62_13]